MAEVKTAIEAKPVWVDLSTDNPDKAREFYGKLFGWKLEVNPDPQYGGYAMANIGDKSVAGIGPKMDPKAPTAWSVYFGSSNSEETAKKIEQAGGKVIAAPFAVGDMGKMAVFQDPSGAFFSTWQQSQPGPFPAGEPNTFGWAELSARGFAKAKPFYTKVFGWTTKDSPVGEGQTYTEFQLDGQSIAGGQEMQPMVPKEVPSYWLVYFAVDDVDKVFKKATGAGARELVSPMDFPGGRFAIVADPQGASFGILKMQPPQK